MSDSRAHQKQQLAKIHPVWYRVMKRVTRAILRPIWKSRFAMLGDGAWVDLPAYIVGHRSIRLGSRVRVWRHVRLEALRATRGVTRIEIGENTGLQPYVHIGAVDSVRIGRSCRLAQGVFITDHDHDFSNLDEPESLGKALISSPVSIGDYVWLGERACVLKGVSIGSMTVVGAGSVVTRDLPPKVMAAGAPARIIRIWDESTKSWVKPA